jgi:hypothetical protein
MPPIGYGQKGDGQYLSIGRYVVRHLIPARTVAPLVYPRKVRSYPTPQVHSFSPLSTSPSPVCTTAEEECQIAMPPLSYAHPKHAFIKSAFQHLDESGPRDPPNSLRLRFLTPSGPGIPLGRIAPPPSETRCSRVGAVSRSAVTSISMRQGRRSKAVERR